MDNVESTGKLIGRSVVSVESANKLGCINDLLADPITGKLAGFSIAKLDDTCALVSILDVHGIGPDAVMVDRDESLVLSDASPLNQLPRAKANLIDVKVITEHGQLLGSISDVFLALLKEPILIYEVRSSIFDKLLGHAFYFAASLSCAFSDDRSKLVVADYRGAMDHKLEAAANRLFHTVKVAAQDPAAVRVEIRSHA